MVYCPGMLIRHAVPELRTPQRRPLRAAYLIAAISLVTYFFAVYLRQPEMCKLPSGR